MRFTLVTIMLLLAATAMAAQIPLQITNTSGVATQAEPITTGVPFPEGALASGDNVRLLDGATEIPLQVTVTGSYPDGSVRWLLLDFQADVPADGRTLTLEFGEGVERAPVPEPLAADTSIAARFLPYFVDDAGNEYNADIADAAEVELEGPMRNVVTARGWYNNGAGDEKCQAIVRIHSYRGKPWMRVFYTWINTTDSREMRFSDIGLSVPMQAQQATFGTADGTQVRQAPAYLLQHEPGGYLISPTDTPDAEQERAPGWFAAEGPEGHVVIACRDFWQYFPKELEATPDAAVFHTWPAHGIADPNREVTDANLQYLWFAHEGDLLDFQVPEAVYNHEGAHSEYEMRYVRSSKDANGMGVAKTHELLVSFGDGPADVDEATDLNARLQQPSIAMASPEWMCASGVFGMTIPEGDERFASYDAMISNTFDAERRMEEFTGDYGLWNFGGGHTSWDPANRRWNDVYRCWRNTHHGCNRVPWLLYVRSADPKYLAYGIRNARKTLDTGFCHWSIEEFEDLPWPQGKLRGALCDYKGLVHWAAGNRLTDYNSTTDFALWYWHMTGDRRGLEVAQLWGDTVVERDRSPFGHREGAGTCAAMIELYKDTLDQRYFDYAKKIADYMITTQKEDGSFPQWENYAPWLERWWELTGDQAAADCIVRWADAYLAGYGDSFSQYNVAGQVNILAYAYAISDDPKYLARGLWELDRITASAYTGEDELLRGLLMAGQTSLSGYGVQRAPNLLAAIAQYGQPVKPDPLFCIEEGFPLPFLRTRPEINGVPTKIETVEAWLLEQQDGAFTVSVSTSHTYETAEWTLIVTAPDGTEAARLVESYPSGERVFELAVPADGQSGVYKLTVARPGSFGKTRHPIVVEPALPVAYPITGRLFPPNEAGFPIWVPAGTTALQVHISTGAGATSVQLTAPDGTRQHWSIGSSDANKLTPPVTVPEDADGALWLLHRAGDVGTIGIVSEGAQVPQLLFQEEYPADVCETFAAAAQ